MTSAFTRLAVGIVALMALPPLETLAQEEESSTAEKQATTSKKSWKHPLFRVAPVREAAVDSKRVALSVSVTNPNERPLAYLAMGAPAKPPHVPVFSVEYRHAGRWRGYLDHDPFVQPIKGMGIRDGELGGGASIQSKISLPTDWERMRVGFSWRMREQKPLHVISWSREFTRNELEGKGQPPAAREAQPPRLRVLSVVKHVNKDFHGASFEIEIRNPNRAPISYYGFAPKAFSPPTPAGRISPFGSRYEVTQKSVTVVKNVLVDCPVGGARLELKPGGKAVYSVWAKGVDEWDSMRIGLTWINGEAGEGQRTTWTEPLKGRRQTQGADERKLD